MPPIKYQRSQLQKGGKYKHYYMHAMPTDLLQKDFEEKRLSPKKLQKVRNELVRRRII